MARSGRTPLDRRMRSSHVQPGRIPVVCSNEASEIAAMVPYGDISRDPQTESSRVQPRGSRDVRFKGFKEFKEDHETDAMSPFEYTPLSRQTRSIRLLRFEDESRTTASTRLSCVMETFKLARCPPFVALSYAWGHPGLGREISVNGKELRIRENLYLAMSVLQGMPTTQVSHDPLREHELIPPYFWVDAICINQDDILERGHQVNLMESIFTGATCVVAWLGFEDDDSKVAIDMIRSRFRGYAGRAASSEGRPDRPNSRLLRSRFQCLTSRPYWNRMWIVQEFILLKNLLILCGDHGAWWEDLLASKPAIVEMMPLQSGWLGLWEARKRWQHSDSLLGDAVDAFSQEPGGDVDQGPAAGMKPAFPGANSLDELLFAFNYAQCSEPRDRIYALLSLVRHRRPQSSETLLPDYTIPAEKLYYRVLAHLRYSPGLSSHESWSRFRAVLFRALELDPNEMSFQLHDELYTITGNLSWQQMAASFQTYERFQYRYLLWWQNLKGYNLFNSDTPTSSYRKLMTLFRTFPRDLDPQAWRDFENLTKTALGIPGLPLTGFLMSAPGLFQIIDWYSRSRQLSFRDESKWSEFTGSPTIKTPPKSEATETVSETLLPRVEQASVNGGSTLEQLRVDYPTRQSFRGIESSNED